MSVRLKYLANLGDAEAVRNLHRTRKRTAKRKIYFLTKVGNGWDNRPSQMYGHYSGDGSGDAINHIDYAYGWVWGTGTGCSYVQYGVPLVYYSEHNICENHYSAGNGLGVGYPYSDTGGGSGDGSDFILRK